MWQSITLGIATILVGILLYFTSYSPICIYSYEKNGDTTTEVCPDSISIFGTSFETQNLCSNTPCFYQGVLGNDNSASLEAFCHWSYPAVTIFGMISLVCYFIATVLSVVIWYRHKKVSSVLLPAIILTVASGALGLVTAGLAFADVGENGCSNEKFQTLFKGRQTPALHYAFAALELVVGLVLVSSAIIVSLPKYRAQVTGMKEKLLE